MTEVKVFMYIFLLFEIDITFRLYLLETKLR